VSHSVRFYLQSLPAQPNISGRTGGHRKRQLQAQHEKERQKTIDEYLEHVKVLTACLILCLFMSFTSIQAVQLARTRVEQLEQEASLFKEPEVGSLSNLGEHEYAMYRRRILRIVADLELIGVITTLLRRNLFGF
jgi:hypothetical protein